MCGLGLGGAGAAELKPDTEVGSAVAALQREVRELAGAAAASRSAQFWKAAARLQEGLSNLDLLFEEVREDDLEDLDAAEAQLLRDLAASIAKVSGGAHADLAAVDGLQERIFELTKARFGRPLPQLVSAGPFAAFAGPEGVLSIVLSGRSFKQSYYEPVLVLRNQKGKEEWLAPKRNADTELVYEVPARYLNPSERQIQIFEAAVEFAIRTGGFLGFMQSDKTWRDRIVVFLLPSRFVTVSGVALSAQPRQEAWRTGAEVCHTNQGAPEQQTVKYECFAPQPGFEIELASGAYVVDRALRASGGRPGGGCQVAADEAHRAARERACIACNPTPDGAGTNATACGKLRWKEVELAARVQELPLNRFSLDGRSPSRFIALPADSNGQYRLQLTYFTGDTVVAVGAYRDDWVSVIPQPQRNAVEVRMNQKLRFE
jgi:hypothetical protein